MQPHGFGKILHLLLNLITAPVRAVSELLGLFSTGQNALLTPERLAQKANRRGAFLAALPSIIAWMAFLALITWGASNRNRINAQYSELLSNAISQTKPNLAQRFGRRVFHGDLRNMPSAAMDYCNFLADQKDLLQANSIIEKLASDDSPGFPPAHAQRAIAYSNLLSQGASDRYLPILHWHLKQAGEPSTEPLRIAWANYQRLTGKIDDAIQSLEAAAKLNPSHWFAVADLYVLDGKPDQARRSLVNAANAYRLALGKNPLSSEDRLQLAIAQARGGDYQQAAETLKTGLELTPQNDQLLRAKNQLEIIRLEQAIKQASTVSQKLDIARKLITISSDPTSVYQSTNEIYQQATTPEDKNLVWQFLQESLDQYGPNASLMFTQSLILVHRGMLSEARDKLQETIQAFPEHGLSLNNLAWLFATEEPKDLPRAKSYAEKAIATDPQIATYHDTLGTIYMELSDWRAAITELEFALAQTPPQGRLKIHGKLAKAYESIGEQTLATLHRQQSSVK
jgi:tetratricopeptide (TPR) repeat protein